jgi:hypothetical protein
MRMTSRFLRQSALVMGALTLMISTAGQPQTEAAKAPAPTLHSSSQVSDAPGKGILPMISGHMAAGLSLYHLDAQPTEQVSPLIQRQYLHGSQSTFSKWIMKKGAVVPLHHHANEQITWITQGGGSIFAGQEIRDARRRHHDHPSQRSARVQVHPGYDRYRYLLAAAARLDGRDGRLLLEEIDARRSAAEPNSGDRYWLSVHASSNSRRASRFARISPCRFFAQ